MTHICAPTESSTRRLGSTSLYLLRCRAGEYENMKNIMAKKTCRMDRLFNTQVQVYLRQHSQNENSIKMHILSKPTQGVGP